METQTLRPINSTIQIKGKIFYSQGDQAWNTLRFRKEIINEFQQLKEKRANFSYKMILHQDYADLEKAIRKLKRDKEALPILLFLCREKDDKPDI